MVTLDENFVIDWIYRVLSEVYTDPDKVRAELLALSSFFANAPKNTDGSVFPKTRVTRTY